MPTEIYRPFRDAGAARALAKAIHARSTHPIRLMEFCGGHTHAILRFGIPSLLPPTVSLRSGPGCPVCVTSTGDLDHAIALAQIPDVILTTFGDMIRVPGSTPPQSPPPGEGDAIDRESPGDEPTQSPPLRRGDAIDRESPGDEPTQSPPPGEGDAPKGQGGRTLAQAKAEGADVRVVYSPLDALRIARDNPDRPVIFLGVGFETTAPMVASAVLAAEAEGLTNFYVFSTHKLTPPATRAILDAGEVALDGIIGPGHVTTVIGAQRWRFLPDDYGIPVAISGFEPLDMLQAVLALVEMAEEGRADVANTYSRSVLLEGNLAAQQAMAHVFEVTDTEWRGFGTVPASGLRIQEAYARFDAARAFPVEVAPAHEPPGCRCGEVLRGVLFPTECALFAKTCTPQSPVGPCMVSAEGACAAYYQYGGRPA
jgi:hydrogenase expression/formation protein HypD